MSTKSISKVLLLFVLLFAQNLQAVAQDEDSDFNPTDMIMHHIQDSYDWHFLDVGETSVSLSLPVILKSDQGWVFFMSSEFHHDSNGEVVVEKNGQRIVNYHEKAYILNDGETGLVFDDNHYPENAVRPIDLSITKNVASIFLTVIVLFLLFPRLAKHYKKSDMAPKGLNNALETLVIFVRDEIAKPQIGSKKYMKFMPYLLTVFFFIWVTNLLGLLPGAANVTGSISVTVALGLFTLILMIFNGTKDYWQHIFWMPGVPVPVRILLAPIELVGMFIKPIALMIRLFANITAGHIIVLSLLGLIFILSSAGVSLVSVPFALFISVLELLVAFLQAFIFTMLSALFIGMAVEEHEHH